MAEQRDVSPFYLPLKAFGLVALALMALAIAYAAGISLINWSGISV